MYEKDARLIFDKSLSAFGLEKITKTDPHVMQAVIKELKLDDFETNNKQIGTLLKNATTEPQNITPFFDDIKKGLISKHPAVIEFAELAITKKWFKPSPHIIESIHILYILELLTSMMCNNHEFFLEVQEHYRDKEKLYGIDSRYIVKSFKNTLKATRNLFGTIKAFLVDPGMIYFQTQKGLEKSLFTKKELKKLYKDGLLNYVEYKMLWPAYGYGTKHLHTLIRINIYEAGITEFKNNLKENSLCSYELSEDIEINPPQTAFDSRNILPENTSNEWYKSIKKEGNRFPVFNFSQEWVSLYTTWNMAFILGNLDNLDILFPKLLIPSMINSKYDNYLGVRIISLWLSVNHYLFRKSNKRDDVEIKNRFEMAKAWGEINKKYALEFAQHTLQKDRETTMKDYNTFFSRPLYSLSKVVREFIAKD